VQQRRCPIPLLVTELDQGPRQGSGLLRRVLTEVAAGIQSVAEAEFRELILAAGLPVPRFNERLRRPDGSLLAVADAWWPEARVAAEVDSREWHLSPADWERTMRRHNQMTAAGIRVLHFSPGQIRRDPRGVAAAIAGALRPRGRAAVAS
jgi:very-short-patch-repair endonuclease